MDAEELIENWKRACRGHELTRRFPEPEDQSNLASHILAKVRGQGQPPDTIVVGAAIGFASSDYQASGEAKYLQLAMLVQEAAKDPDANHRAALGVLTLVGQATVGLLLTTWRGEAEVDELTRLGNRRKMEGIVADLTAHGSRFAYASIDADGLKAINDTGGHEAGDQFLRELGEELRAAAAEIHAEAFRYGGDEFGIVLPLGTEAERLTEKLEETQGRLAAANRFFSVGVDIWPDGDPDPSTVLQTADRRMYEQKQARKAAAQSQSPEEP